eukprot:TRINITY_DN105172_c0_g1_i1.p1 TRINITY_DN105172_c0_g1~~TRINITY_DN105172_c0_g1_i1.p1  ORF type:complete len:168 (+),score=1.99 TRINITY_DN105172_c0_g1_i1:184-687(+)
MQSRLAIYFMKVLPFALATFIFACAVLFYPYPPTDKEVKYQGVPSYLWITEYPEAEEILEKPYKQALSTCYAVAAARVILARLAAKEKVKPNQTVLYGLEIDTSYFASNGSGWAGGFPYYTLSYISMGVPQRRLNRTEEAQARARKIEGIDAIMKEIQTNGPMVAVI